MATKKANKNGKGKNGKGTGTVADKTTLKEKIADLKKKANSMVAQGIAFINGKANPDFQELADEITDIQSKLTAMGVHRRSRIDFTKEAIFTVPITDIKGLKADTLEKDKEHKAVITDGTLYILPVKDGNGKKFSIWRDGHALLKKEATSKGKGKGKGKGKK